MYSCSLNTSIITNLEQILFSFITRLFSESAQQVIEITEYKENDIEQSLDIEDVNKSLQGNHDAYKRLIERHQQRIGNIIWRFSRDPLVHEELVQDVFVEAYLSLITYKHKAPFIHWLRKIAIRVGYHYWKEQARQRKRKKFTVQEWDQILEKTTQDLDSDQAADLVHKLLEQLPPRDRLVLTLRFLEGCDVAQTAYRTGWSKSMVKVQTIRAKRKLINLFPKSLKRA